jgi:hypothetical protein
MTIIDNTDRPATRADVVHACLVLSAASIHWILAIIVFAFILLCLFLGQHAEMKELMRDDDQHYGV